jgi:hypothetical protein
MYEPAESDELAGVIVGAGDDLELEGLADLAGDYDVAVTALRVRSRSEKLKRSISAT